MKLTIGENIRKFRKKNDLTQEAFAERLGVTYQSVSRWENGITYPDIELLPAICRELSVTADELIGIPSAEKEKRAEETFDALRRECMKRDYDAERIVELLRDIRINYMDSDLSWRPWAEGNDRAFRDPKILPEVRLLAEAELARHPMSAHVMQTMATVEDEEHLEAFLKKYTTSFDCSARALLFMRYWRRMDEKGFEQERRYQLYHAFNDLLCPRYLRGWKDDERSKAETNCFMENMLAVIRSDAIDERPDMWVADRLEQGINSAARLAEAKQTEGALAKIKTAVELLEETMKITDEVVLPTSCRFLDGMVWRAKEEWSNRDNNPDGSEERMIYVYTQMSGLITCSCIFPSNFLEMLKGKEFESIRGNAEFEALCARVRALVAVRDIGEGVTE